MASPLLTICVAAFIAVFALLAALALGMRVLMAVFPERGSTGADPAMLAAISSAASAAHPGMQVTRIEEEK